MISIQKGLEDYRELGTIIKGINDINSLVELIYDNPTYNIINDLRDTKGLIDLNFKNIWATIKQNNGYLTLLPEVEVWDEEKTLNFINVNMFNYSQYNVKFNDNGELCINIIKPYDEQDYYYIVGNKVYRQGKYIETIEDNEPNLDGIDVMILRLIELNRVLEPRICHN